jgi:hypothetical protein
MPPWEVGRAEEEEPVEVKERRILLQLEHPMYKERKDLVFKRHNLKFRPRHHCMCFTFGRCFVAWILMTLPLQHLKVLDLTPLRQFMI